MNIQVVAGKWFGECCCAIYRGGTHKILLLKVDPYSGNRSRGQRRSAGPLDAQKNTDFRMLKIRIGEVKLKSRIVLLSMPKWVSCPLPFVDPSRLEVIRLRDSRRDHPLASQKLPRLLPTT